ncbi:transposase [Thioclava sp.]|uniref:transposase n=1 Tax=Thioclava sp. TaxID=1933450 RepID=UPI003AA7EE88
MLGKFRTKERRITDEFKQDAVAQVLERGYAVSEVAERLEIRSLPHRYHATLSVSIPEIAATRLSSVTSSVVNVRIIRP